MSIKIDDMSFEELSWLMQGLCRDANKLREQIRYVAEKINARVAAGEGSLEARRGVQG